MLIQGKAKWTKVLGEPVWGFENKFKEWSVDVYIDEETAHRLEVEGLLHKIKDKGTGQYISFKRKELKTDGTPNQHIRVVDHRGQDWDPKQKIGNGSTVNVNFAINEFGKGKTDKSANILSMQVWDLVKFDNEFPTREDTPSEDWAEEVADS